MSLIADDFKHGNGLKLGELVIVEPDVVVGDNVKLGHRCTLKSGTRIGDNSIIDDHCITTGACWIGDNVNIRTGAIISKATIIEDWVFVGPGVITNHTKHVTHGRPSLEHTQHITYIGHHAVIGSGVKMVAGIDIQPNVIIGAGSVVVRDLRYVGIYAGSPAVQIKDLPSDWWGEPAEKGNEHYKRSDIFEHLKRYMPQLVTL